MPKHPNFAPDFKFTYDMRKLFSLLLIALPMLAFAQSIEVKYSVYSKKRVEAINKIKEYKYDEIDYLDIFSVWYRDVLLFKATNDVNDLVFKQEIQYIKSVAKKTSYEKIDDIVKALEKAKSRIKAKANFETCMTLLLEVIKGTG